MGILAIVLISGIVSFTAVRAADLTFQASVDRTSISKSQTLTLTFQVEGSVSNLSKPELPDLSDFRIISGPNESSTFQIINGQYSSLKTWSYVLKPRRAGNLTIGAAKIKHKREIYVTEPINVVVRNGGSVSKTPGGDKTLKPSVGQVSPDLFVRVAANKARLYQNEQVILTYTIYTRVSVSTYEISRLPSAPGFWTEEFQLPPQPTVQDEVISGRHYRKALIRKVALFSTRTGELTVDPLEVSCQVQVQDKQQRRRDPFDVLFDSPFSRYRTENRFIETQPLKLKVIPVPTAEKPDNFSGAVGDFSLEVGIDRQEVTTNEALTMTVRYSGTGNIKMLPHPNFTAPPDFESYDPKESVKVNKSGNRVFGTKTYEFVLIPRIPGESGIPPIEFSYFDPGKKAYQTITKGGYTIMVERGKGDVAASVPGMAKEEVKLLAEDIHYLMTPGRLQKIDSAFVISTGYWVAVAMPPIFTVLFFWMAKFMGASTMRARRKDRKIYTQAKKEIQVLIKTATEKLNSNEEKSAIYGSIHRILLGYLGRRLGMPASGLKETEVLGELTNFNAPNEIISNLNKIFQECNLARFAPQQADARQLNRTLILSNRILDNLEEGLGSHNHTKKRSSSKLLTALIITLSITAISSSQVNSDSDPQAAEDLYRKGDYGAAIANYEQTIAQGLTSGEIYYNMGNCYYKTGKYGQAILYYERSKRFLGNNPDLVHNLKLTNMRIFDRIEPLPRIFLTKTFIGIAESMLIKTWAAIFMISEWLLLVSLIGLNVIRKPMTRQFLVWGFTVTLVITIISGGFFLHQKASQGNLTEAVVLSESVEVHSAPEIGSVELFTLHEGVKMRILREVSGWVEILLQDGKRGWMPKTAFETI